MELSTKNLQEISEALEQFKFGYGRNFEVLKFRLSPTRPPTFSSVGAEDFIEMTINESSISKNMYGETVIDIRTN